MARKRPVKVPEVSIEKWMKSGPFKIMGGPNSSPRGTPAIMVHGKKANKETVFVSVWGETHNDGVSLHFVSNPYVDGAPVLNMKFQEWKPERGMAAILSVIALYSESPRFPKAIGPVFFRKCKMGDDWLRKMKNKIMKSFYAEGKSFVERGIDPVLIEFEGLVADRFKSLAGLNVKESLDRVKKEFKLLIDHISEEDMIEAWRETVVSKVIQS
jgi:hypothetical protein